MNFFKYLYKGIVEFLKMLGIAIGVVSWIFLLTLIGSSDISMDQKKELFVAVTVLLAIIGMMIYGWVYVNCKDNCKPE